MISHDVGPVSIGKNKVAVCGMHFVLLDSLIVRMCVGSGESSWSVRGLSESSSYWLDG